MQYKILKYTLSICLFIIILLILNIIGFYLLKNAGSGISFISTEWNLFPILIFSVLFWLFSVIKENSLIINIIPLIALSLLSTTTILFEYLLKDSLATDGPIGFIYFFYSKIQSIFEFLTYLISNLSNEIIRNILFDLFYILGIPLYFFGVFKISKTIGNKVLLPTAGICHAGISGKRKIQ